VILEAMDDIGDCCEEVVTVEEEFDLE